MSWSRKLSNTNSPEVRNITTTETVTITANTMMTMTAETETAATETAIAIVRKMMMKTNTKKTLKT